MDASLSIVLLHYSLKDLLFAANRAASQFVQSVGIAGSDAQEVFQNTGHFTILGNPYATRLSHIVSSSVLGHPQT